MPDKELMSLEEVNQTAKQSCRFWDAWKKEAFNSLPVVRFEKLCETARAAHEWKARYNDLVKLVEADKQSYETFPPPLKLPRQLLRDLVDKVTNFCYEDNTVFETTICDKLIDEVFTADVLELIK